MKKLATLCLLGLVHFHAVSLVSANDGSLQIDTSLDQQVEKTEIQYFEQEGDLIKLFRPDTDQLIARTQELDKEVYQETKSHLFLEDTNQEKVVDNYQVLLFTPETAVATKADYGVSLNTVRTPLSWPVVILSILGGAVMLFSIFQRKLRPTNKK